MAQAIGQTGDLCKSIDDMPPLAEIKRGDVCGAVYQALSRGSCRYSVEGKAMPMNVWMTNWDDKIKMELERVMPKLTWKDWDMGNARDTTKAETIALQISAHLRGHLGDRVAWRSSLVLSDCFSQETLGLPDPVIWATAACSLSGTFRLT